MNFIHKFIEMIRLKLWRRSQHDNQQLRTYFRERYRIDVGLYSYGCFDQWRMPGPIRVGRYCSIANSVRSAPINHPYQSLSTHPALFERKFGAVDNDIHWDDVLEIEDDVWIGHGAILLPRCKKIGRGAIVGAGSVVTRDVAAYSIVAGNPARLLKMRFDPDLIAAIEETKWWLMDMAALRSFIIRHEDVVFHPTTQNLLAWHSGDHVVVGN